MANPLARPADGPRPDVTPRIGPVEGGPSPTRAVTSRASDPPRRRPVEATGREVSRRDVAARQAQPAASSTDEAGSGTKAGVAAIALAIAR